MPLADIAGAEVTIEKLVAGGDGLAHLGVVPIFVPRSCPGDRLLVRITERRPDFGRAEIVGIVEAGPGRRPDPYPDLALTGAADLQHIDDALQPQLKAAATREALVHIGQLVLPASMPLHTGAPWGYRLRTQLHAAVDAAGGARRVGYFARGTHQLIPLQHCALLVPELDALLAELPERLPAAPPERIDLAAGDSGQVTAAPPVEGLPQGEVTMTVGENRFAYDARCFFQGHRGLLAELVATAVGPWEGAEAFDLYAGVGLFSLPLARLYGRVTAVEADPVAMRYARTNARRNHLANVEAVPQAVESWAARLPDHAARVIVDPPRSGLSGRLRQVLLASAPLRLTYVSCHAATLARDLRVLGERYEVESVELFDLFPQTGHMEVVAQLVRRDPAPS